MQYGTALDFYDNNGVICDTTNYIFYSLNSNKLDLNNYDENIKKEWKLVSLPHLDKFKADDITKIKDVLNNNTYYQDESHSLHKCMKLLGHACFNKDNISLNNCLKLILDINLNNI